MSASQKPQEPQAALPGHADDKALPAHSDNKALPAHTDGHAKAKGNDGQAAPAGKARGKKWEPSDDQEDELEFELPPPHKVTKKKGLLFVIIAIVVIALAFILGFIPKWRQSHVVREEADETAKSNPRVELVTPKMMAENRPLELPGIIQALEDTIVYPRATGYVRRWLVDIGDQVKEGQLLAEIDTPDLDAQIEQARADLAQAEASEIRAETSSSLSLTERKRYETLTPAGVTTGQDLESRRTQARVDEAQVKVAKATIASQQAALNRLTRLKAFARPVAPFNGTITARTIERGQLVTPATTSPMFRIEALDPVRIFVQVPQDVAPSIQTGTRSAIHIREFPQHDFEGTISRAAGALDDTTRTMTTEIRVPNSKHELLPGMYVKAVLSLAVPHHVFEIPSTTLYINADGVRVAVVDANNEVSMRKVNIERDTGNFIQISSGLDGTERIVKIANAAISNGAKVTIMETPKEEKGPEQKAADQKAADQKSGAAAAKKTDSDEGAEKSALPGGVPKKDAEPALREMKPPPKP